MQPIDMDGNEWDNNDSRVIFRKIRVECIDTMRKRDVQRQPDLANGKAYRLNTEGSKTFFKADPLLADAKHTGRETKRLLHSKWGAFCSERRNPSDYVGDTVIELRRAEIASMIAAADGLELPTEKRSPGRPRGSKTKTTADESVTATVGEPQTETVPAGS